MSMIVYNGPTKLPPSLQENETEIIQMGYGGSISTSAGGVINTVIDAYSQLTSSADWASIQNTWNQYRILSLDTTFYPWNTYNMPTTNVLVPVWSTVDRGDSTALSSITVAASYGSAKLVSPSKPFNRKIKMASIEEADFLPTSSSPASASRFYIKLYSSGNSNSISVYDYQTIVLIQVRGRK